MNNKARRAAEPLKAKKYIVDFYQLVIEADDQIHSIEEGLEKIRTGELPASFEDRRFVRDIWELISSEAGKNLWFGGQFRKFRMEDLPEVGKRNSEPRELDLAEDEGLIERNFFVYFKEHQILGWHKNGNGNTPNQLASCLSDIFQVNVKANPIIQPDALARLMAGKVELKKITISIPKPSSGDFYAEDDFSKRMLELLKTSGADSLHLTLGVDGRRQDSEGKLTSKLKNALKELGQNSEPSTLRADVFEDGLEHPIDLIADRVNSTQSVETNHRYPPSRTMYRAIKDAKKECQEAIDAYFNKTKKSGT